MAYPWHIHGIFMAYPWDATWWIAKSIPTSLSANSFPLSSGPTLWLRLGLSGCICLAELPNSHQHAVLLWFKGKSAGKTSFFHVFPKISSQTSNKWRFPRRNKTFSPSLSPSESPYFHQGPRTPPRLAAVHGWVRHLERLSARHVRCATTSRLNFRRHPRPWGVAAYASLRWSVQIQSTVININEAGIKWDK